MAATAAAATTNTGPQSNVPSGGGGEGGGGRFSFSKVEVGTELIELATSRPAIIPQGAPSSPGYVGGNGKICQALIPWGHQTGFTKL